MARETQIDVGTLRHRVKVQQPVTSKSATGAEQVTPTTVATRWAAIEPAQGDERFEAQQTTAGVTHRVLLRHDDTLAAVTPKWRLLFGSRVFEVVSVINAGERGASLELLCKETF